MTSFPKQPVRRNSRSILLGAAIASSLVLSGCAGSGGEPADTAYVARDVETLYTEARDRLSRGNAPVAAALFDEVERQHPYSPWARRAQLMSAFSYYVAADYNKAIQSAQRFLSIHPGNKDAPYAYYLIALSYYEQISDVQRDQKTISRPPATRPKRCIAWSKAASRSAFRPKRRNTPPCSGRIIRAMNGTSGPTTWCRTRRRVSPRRAERLSPDRIIRQFPRQLPHRIR